MTNEVLERDICQSMIFDIVIQINEVKLTHPHLTEFLDHIIDSVNEISNRDNPDCIKFGLVQVAVDLTISLTGCMVRGCPGREHEAYRKAIEIIWSARQGVVSNFVEEASLLGTSHDSG